MAFIQASVLYDFQGDPASGELTIVIGDVLTVIRQDVGDGWWEARNERTGQQGLVPEAYVEITSVPEPSMPPPPPPAGSWVSQPTAPLAAPFGTVDENDSALAPPDGQPAYYSGNEEFNKPQPHGDEDWDDDWDDDSTTGDQEESLSSRGLSQSGTLSKKVGSSSTAAWTGFSVFAKSGGDSYLIGTATGTPTEEEKIYIVDTEYGPVWGQQKDPYTCVIASPKKENKYHGLKSYISYQLTPSFSNIQVSRRYKHFDWLHSRLLVKFPCIAVPPLPDKQVTGRYEDDFIAQRMRQLQLWVDRMVRHPVVGGCTTTIHFMECGADEKRWKLGKRKAEKDEFQGAKFFLTIQVPGGPLEMSIVEQDLETFNKFTRTMDDSIKQLSSVMEYNAKKHQGPFRREFQKIGSSFSALAAGFELDSGIYSGELTRAIHHTGKTYDDIGHLYAGQPCHDSFYVLDTLLEYKGLLSAFPDILQTQKAGIVKVREYQKLEEEGKLSKDELEGVMARSDTISYSVMAEQKYFQLERVNDYKLMMTSYLREQINFYKKITAKLEDTLQVYENMA